MYNYYIDKKTTENKEILRELDNEQKTIAFFRNFSDIAIISLVVRMLATGGQVAPITGIIVFLLFGIGTRLLLIAIQDKVIKIKKENIRLNLFNKLEKNPLKY